MNNWVMKDYYGKDLFDGENPFFAKNVLANAERVIAMWNSAIINYRAHQHIGPITPESVKAAERVISLGQDVRKLYDMLPARCEEQIKMQLMIEEVLKRTSRGDTDGD